MVCQKHTITNISKLTIDNDCDPVAIIIFKTLKGHKFQVVPFPLYRGIFW